MSEQTSLAGVYTLVTNLFRGGKHHRAGSEIELSHDDAATLLEQGTVKAPAPPAAETSPSATGTVLEGARLEDAKRAFEELSGELDRVREDKSKLLADVGSLSKQLADAQEHISLLEEEVETLRAKAPASTAPAAPVPAAAETSPATKPDAKGKK